MKSNQANLKNPDGQVQETLYELITNKRISISHIRNVCGILSEHKILSILRIRHGVKINPIETKIRNKWGRVVSFNLYELEDRDKAIKIYNALSNSN